LAQLKKAKKDESSPTINAITDSSAATEGGITEEVVKKEYHESIINDVYNSMSDSEEEDEEETQKQLQDQISSEAKAKEEEIKRQKEAALPLT